MDRHTSPINRRKLQVLLASLLASGTLFGTCETRLRDAVVQGTETFVIGLLSPANFDVDFGSDGTLTGN